MAGWWLVVLDGTGRDYHTYVLFIQSTDIRIIHPEREKKHEIKTQQLNRSGPTIV